MNATYRRFGDWFHADGDAHGLAAVRVGFGLYGLWMIWDLFPRRHLLYGPDGVHPGMSLARHLSGFKQLLWHFETGIGVDVVVGAFALASACMVVGVFCRGAVLVAFLCHVLLDARNGYASFGADSVYRHMMFWMLFAQCGRVWSLDAYLRPRPASAVPLWPLRCMQIQVAVVYLFTGYFKLKTEVWADGSAVYYALHTFGMQTSCTAWLLEQRAALVGLTYATLVFELVFAVGVFTSYRFLFLLGGVMLHLGIDLFMMIRLFSLAMFCSYLSYLEPEHWERVRAFFRRAERGKPPLTGARRVEC